jgi:two-component system CheB/CheR fusion protein
LLAAASLAKPTLNREVTLPGDTGDSRTVSFSVRPLPGHAADGDSLLLVSFQDVSPPPCPARRRGQAWRGSHQRRCVARGRTRARSRLHRENLQATIEEQQASNEELKSANEELQSTNEELQSTNEELETSKENCSRSTRS